MMNEDEREELEQLRREKQAGQFWSVILNDCDDVAKQIALELTDYSNFLTETSKVYDYITRGKVSKINTHAHVIIQMLEEYINADIKEGIEEELEYLKDGNSTDDGYTLIPIDPPEELLVSMAIRSDHALAIPGYYDQDIFKGTKAPHQTIFEATVLTMKQVYEEVAGIGFYSSDRKGFYSNVRERTSLVEKLRLAAKHKMTEQEFAAQRESWSRSMEPCEHGVYDFESCQECRK